MPFSRHSQGMLFKHKLGPRQTCGFYSALYQLPKRHRGHSMIITDRVLSNMFPVKTVPYPDQAFSHTRRDTPKEILRAAAQRRLSGRGAHRTVARHAPAAEASVKAKEL